MGFMAIVVHRAGEAAKGQLRDGWGTLTWLASGATVGARGIAAARVVIRRGQTNPRHAHPTCEEVLYLMAGRLRHSVGAESVELEAGDTLYIPAGVFHNAASIGEEDADMIVVYSNGQRDFVLENAGGDAGCGKEP